MTTDEKSKETTDLLREALAWLEHHAGWEYGFSVDELESLKARMRGHLLALGKEPL